MSAIKRLYEKWPDIPHGWNDLPDGWFDLVDKLITDLNQMPGWTNQAIEQIKEKFLGLRVYISYSDKDGNDYTFNVKEVDKLIGAAEQISESTCMICGKPGELDKKYRMQILCEEHSEENDAIKNFKFED